MPLDNYIDMVGGKTRLLSASEMAKRELDQMEAGKYYSPTISTYTGSPPEVSGGGVIEYRPADAFARPALGHQPLLGNQPLLRR